MRHLPSSVQGIWSIVIVAACISAGCYPSVRRGSSLNQTNGSRSKATASAEDKFTLGGVEVSPQEFVDRGGRCAMIRRSPGTAGLENERLNLPRPDDCFTIQCPPNIDGKNLDQAKEITVYFHVITKGDEVSDGNISEQTVREQIRVLNEKFSRTHFKFTLALPIDYRGRNLTWFGMTPCSQEERDAMDQLGVKEKKALNIYTVASPDIAGWTVFPWDFSTSPYHDGVVIRFSTVPGGTDPHYNLGMTLVHEVGHWLGLLHTFEHSCAAPGDCIEDTAAEAHGNANVCDVPPNSCGTPTGDPIHNFMDTSPDRCVFEFTDGQIDRMDHMFAEYRQ